MVKKAVLILGGILLFAVLGWAAMFYWKNFRGIWPIFERPKEDISRSLGLFKLPLGFSISVFAENLPGARVMRLDPYGAGLLVSRASEGAVTVVGLKNLKMHAPPEDILVGLNNPHGLAFDPQNPETLYVAEEDKISVWTYVEDFKMGKRERVLKKIIDLPGGAGHFTRTIGFGPDGRLYVSIGSSCNVCVESDSRRAKIFSMKKDGSDFKEYARGLRNAVFFTWNKDGKMWATEMGRDFLGDDLPPDEIDIIEEGSNYGWPICYGNNIHDTEFDKNTYIRSPCAEPYETPSFIDIPAHSAPLGLAFIPKDGWPEEYRGDLIVAYHGSWNRSAPAGYKVVRYDLDENGEYLGEEDFITGWLSKDGVIGRPVDVLVLPGGVMFISDDKAGVIYKVTYVRE